MSTLYGGLTAYNQFVVYEKIWDATKGKFNKKPCDIGGSRFNAATETKFNHLDPRKLFCDAECSEDFEKRDQLLKLRLW